MELNEELIGGPIHLVWPHINLLQVFINSGDLWSNNEAINSRLLLTIAGVMKTEIYNATKQKVCTISEQFTIPTTLQWSLNNQDWVFSSGYFAPKDSEIFVFLFAADEVFSSCD